MILAFDTETTGLANFRLPASHESQPHLVQIGAMLVDENFTVRNEINLIVKPEGWTIPASASSVHGITQEVAEQVGLPKGTVLDAFASRFAGAYGDYKWPKLTEAYWHAFQELLPDAHDAMADVRACLRLFRWIQYQAGVKTPIPTKAGSQIRNQ